MSERVYRALQRLDDMATSSEAMGSNDINALLDARELLAKHLVVNYNGATYRYTARSQADGKDDNRRPAQDQGTALPVDVSARDGAEAAAERQEDVIPVSLGRIRAVVLDLGLMHDGSFISGAAYRVLNHDIEVLRAIEKDLKTELDKG